MMPLLEPGLGSGDTARIPRQAASCERRMEAEKRENADGRASERERETERERERERGGGGRKGWAGTGLHSTGNLMRSRVTENCLTYRFYWNVRRPRKNGARGPNW